MIGEICSHFISDFQFYNQYNSALFEHYKISDSESNTTLNKRYENIDWIY